MSESTTDQIRMRKSKLFDAVLVMAVGAITLLVVLPALIPLVVAVKAHPCVQQVPAPAGNPKATR